MVSLPCLSFLAWLSLGYRFCLSSTCFCPAIGVFQRSSHESHEDVRGLLKLSLCLSGRPRKLRGRSPQALWKGRGSYLEAVRSSWASLKPPRFRARLVSLAQGQPRLPVLTAAPAHHVEEKTRGTAAVSCSPRVRLTGRPQQKKCRQWLVVVARVSLATPVNHCWARLSPLTQPETSFCSQEASNQ